MMEKEKEGRLISANMLFEVCVPAGISPGDTFQVQVADSQVFDVTAPEGCKAGSSINIDVAVDLKQSSEALQVEVPTGCLPGETLNVVTPDGRTVLVVVPDDSAPGSLLEVMEVPETSKVLSEGAESPSSVRTAFDDEGAAGTEPASGSPLPHRKKGSASHIKALRQLAARAPAVEDTAEEQEFDFDDSYLIQRSDGSYTRGFIQSYDRSCGLYHVLVVGAGYKYVSREQIELDTIKF